MFENIHFIYDTIQKLMQKCEKCDFMESVINNLKKTYDEHLDNYLQTTIYYILPFMKDLKQAKEHNSLYQKAFGNKNLGSNFEKMVKRVHKHLCKEHFLI